MKGSVELCYSYCSKVQADAMMLFSVKYTIGIFSSDKNNISNTFGQFSTYSAKGKTYWAAATTHNAVQEYRSNASLESIGQPSQGINIFISKSGSIGASGVTPMYAKRYILSLPRELAFAYLASNSLIIDALINVVRRRVDMIIGYRYENANGIPDINALVSDELKETVYHELTHAGHYAALGNAWFSTFVTAEEVEIISNLSSGFRPYGDGTNSSSAIVALGESWAYYMGHYMADRTYGITASCQNEQDNLPGTTWCNTNGTGHPHLDVEENFNPHLTADRFEWIPQGLFYDLRDNRNDFLFDPSQVNDQVTGYTNAQMFSAFQSNIFTIQSYRGKLLQISNNGNNSVPVTSLFTQYGYQ